MQALPCLFIQLIGVCKVCSVVMCKRKICAWNQAEGKWWLQSSCQQSLTIKDVVQLSPFSCRLVRNLVTGLGSASWCKRHTFWHQGLTHNVVFSSFRPLYTQVVMPLAIRTTTIHTHSEGLQNLANDSSTCRLRGLGMEPLTVRSLDNWSTAWARAAPQRPDQENKSTKKLRWFNHWWKKLKNQTSFWCLGVCLLAL